METAIVTALVASGTSLCATITQMFWQRVFQRKQNRTNEEQSRAIEILKADLARQSTTYAEYLKAYLKLQVDGETQEIQAFREVLQTAQLVKDKARLIVEHPNSFPDRDLMRSELTQLRTQVLETFARNQIAFSEDHWRLAHSLKNICSETLTAIIQADVVTEATVANLLKRLSSQHQDMRREAYATVTTLSNQLHISTQ